LPITSYTVPESAIEGIIERFSRLELHASRAGREVMDALSRVVEESDASDLESLARRIETCINAILEVMPAYAPPLNVMHMVMHKVESAHANQSTAQELKQSILCMANDYRMWSDSAREKIGLHGTNLISRYAKVFTFTLSETILRTLLKAWEAGNEFDVLVTESRPNNDGLITLEKLSQKGIRVYVGIDASIGELIPKADIMLVGAEAILANGSAICKVGTYPCALLARQFGVPVYIVVDTMKFDISSRIGLTMSMDPIHPHDFYMQGNHERAEVVGHLFDATPPSLIDGIVTEQGILQASECAAMISQMHISETLSSRISGRASAQRN